METCGTCRFAYERDGSKHGIVCCADIPANLAKALGVDSPFNLPEADTHPEWSCVLWKEERR